ncbi:esterase-like activity of phytase family protein [Mycolicibacterium vaccae]|jgi:hypothetical protein|uniref:Phytase-like domain-containing protein n=1 Tax=Mycolicibacterium vaccae ATCC 25954 TaxID=1194972 RepID=K0UZ39_MYCVA|nr:esterase-like activity of phytase family protein [Mycolicibacterium vaccae]EJZ12051.1 hypothetical protein MVAC_03906 [Mycolicibacterium vaccae ATCC 25954]
MVRSFSRARTPWTLAAAAVLLAGCTAGQAGDDSSRRPTEFTHLGTTELPHRQVHEGTTVGGLSGISYDAERDVYYVISDDRSAHGPARFYTVDIDFTADGIAAQLRDSTALLDRTGAPFAALQPDATPPVIPPDPEGIAYDTRRQQIYWSSEGARDLDDPTRALLLDPWVRLATLDGAFRAQLPLPPIFTMSAGESGPRENVTLEGLTLTPSGRYLFAGMEGPGHHDGPLPTEQNGALARVIRFDPESGTPSAQYAYPLDPVSAGPGGDNGLSDLVALDDENFLVIERGYADHSVARIYRASTSGAEDVSNRPSLTGPAPRTMTKELLVDLVRVPQIRRLDNIEGITLGPTLPDGRPTVVLVTDDNFSEKQTTQFHAFAVDTAA